MNEKNFNNSQGAGLVSALLCCALEHKDMHRALTVVVIDLGIPPRRKPRFVRSEEEIIRVHKSNSIGRY